MSAGGWISISYRRISDCLEILGKEGAVNYCRLSAMFDCLYRVFQSRDVWPLMPYEKSKFILFVSSFLDCNLTIFLSKVSEYSDNNGSQGIKRKGRKLTTPPSKKHSKQKMVSDSTQKMAAESTTESLSTYFEETTPKKLTLCTYGKVELRDFHKRDSSFGKLLSYQQTLQLALSTVRVCFKEAIHSKYKSDESFMEQLFGVIFFKCSERRMMLEGEPLSFYKSPLQCFPAHLTRH